MQRYKSSSKRVAVRPIRSVHLFALRPILLMISKKACKLLMLESKQRIKSDKTYETKHYSSIGNNKMDIRDTRDQMISPL